ncbi:hypothetical protein BC941DRAFT_409281 [Chlamydoabsidia padenii]|nr:hypothetical protein BC941DRAFT_409281 [Chlamydoabsidia padenii]
MNTPPPENSFPMLDLVPSLSMPVLQPVESTTITKRRRHTITRPDGALLSDHSDQDESEDQALDRISDILSHLIQQANDAVQNHQCTNKSRSSHGHASSTRSRSTLVASRLPRPKSRSSQYWIHDRHSSISSTASSNSLFSPVLTMESPMTASSIEHNGTLHPFGIPPCTLSNRNDMELYKRAPSPNTFDHPLMESFRRLDTSMALVDSLSRDLAQQEEEEKDSGNNNTTKFTLLLLIPLLHIPHALITTVFDTSISPGNTNSTTASSFGNHSSTATVTTPSSISGIIAWSIFFALANMVITWSSPTRPHHPRRLSLPGSYQHRHSPHNASSLATTSDNKLVRSQRPAPINTTLCIVKKSSSTTCSRRGKRSTPSASRKRIISRHKYEPKTIKTSRSNDRTYTMAIQELRLWEQDWKQGGMDNRIHQVTRDQKGQQPRRRYSL